MKLQISLKRTVFSLFVLSVLFILQGFTSSAGKDLEKNPLQSFLLENRISGKGDLPDWVLLDPDKDGYEGVRTNEFYKFLKTLNPVPQRTDVTVAVIDSGFDINHEDLQDNIWKNEKELKGVSGVDDDNNGYTDDFYGWNFLGNKFNASLEVTREYYRLKNLGTDETDFYFKKVKKEFEDKRDEIMSTQEGVSETLAEYINAENVLKSKNITSDPKKLMEISEGLKGKYQDAASMILGIYMLFGTDKNDLIELDDEYKLKSKVLFDSLDLDTETENTLLEKNYGNNNVLEETEIHGTHVSGIIGSKKTGQAHFVKIMCLRAVPNQGDERDKDIGNAIRYAVDNGASIINMSAGKYFSPHPDFVVDAIKYAEENNVLFVVSAGNEGMDITEIVNYPRKYLYENGNKKYFSNMIVVGASTWMKQWNEKKDPENENSKYDLAASFSNYSGEVVDVFAPGARINSTAPGNKYKVISGTSMAAPVVSGIAAVLKSYYPQLTAAQLKESILSSTRQYENLNVKIKGKPYKVRFSELSKSGGVADLISAFRKAGELAAIQN